MMTRPWALASAGLLAGALVVRALGFEGTRFDALLMLGSVGFFVALQAVLMALRVPDLVRILYGYVATPHFGNRALSEVWLGSSTEGSAGTFAPVLLADVLLLLAIVRRWKGVPLAPMVAAAVLGLPALAGVFTSEFHVGAFGYQWAALVRLVVVAWFVRRELLTVGARVTASNLVVHLGLVFAAMALVSGTVAVFTGARFGWPGWGTNVYANVLAIVAILVVAHVGVVRRRFAIGVVAAAAFGMVGSGTRVALALLVVVLAATLLYRLTPRRTRRVLGSAIVVTLGGLAVAIPGVVLEGIGRVSPRFEVIGGVRMTADVGLPGLVGAVARESSVRTRMDLWDASLAMVAQHPLTGVGWGQWNWLKAPFGVRFDVLLDPHNGYLWLLAEGGIVVAAFVVIVAGAVVLRVRRTRFLVPLLLVLVLEFTNANVQKALFAVVVGVLVGAALAERERRRAVRAEGQSA